MRNLLKNYFNIFVVLLLLCSFSCNKNKTQESVQILAEVSALKGTDYSEFATVIEHYNIVNDSLRAISASKEAGLNSYLLDNVDEKNDTLLLAVRIIDHTPSEMGRWMATTFTDYAFNSGKMSVEQRSENMMQRLEIARFLYFKTGEPSSIAEMEKAIDETINNLDIPRRAKLYTLMSSPEELAHAITADNDNKDNTALIESIRNCYSNDSDALNRFNNIIIAN